MHPASQRAQPAALLSRGHGGEELALKLVVNRGGEAASEPSPAAERASRRRPRP